MAKRKSADTPALRRLGRELARLRKLADMSQDHLGNECGLSGGMIGHIERAERSPTKRFVAKADEVLGANGHLLGLWPDVIRSTYPEYAGSFMEALPHASMIRDYHPMIVPGLFQTEDYVRAFFRASNRMETEDYIEGLVEQRVRRQTLLEESNRPVIWGIITEAVIACLAGTPRILLGQVDRLLHLMEARIQLQMIPGTVPFDQHPGMDGPFTILSLPEQQQEVAYIEGAISGSLITDTEAVRRLSLKFGNLQGAALSPQQTADYLMRIRGEIDGQKHYTVAPVELQQRGWGTLRRGGGDTLDGPPDGTDAG